MLALRSPRFVALAALSVASAGCTTSMSVRSMEPGRVYVGSANHLIIFDGTGRRSAREFVSAEIVRQARAGGFFSVEDRSEDGTRLRIVGRTVELEGGVMELGPRQVGVRVDVLEWSSFRDEKEIEKKDADGAHYVEFVRTLNGRVLLAVTLFDAEGSAILAESEYEGHASTEDFETPREDVIDAAGREAIAYFLRDITPYAVTSRVRLDEEDEGQEPILETARRGNVALAADDMRRFLEGQPNNAIAAYNLAVFLEATGEFAEAIEWYDRSLSLGGKDYYSSARANCARRLAAMESLSTEQAGD